MTTSPSTRSRGEIVALLGENGAGKTTLMNILFGHYVADGGRVLVDGRALPPGRPGAAIAAGVGMVHQHFALAANLTVLDNVTTGTEPLLALRRAPAAARAKLAALGERFGLAVDPDARVGDLSVGERQRVEILKALYNDARILILDEPTAVLTAPEAETLVRNPAGDGARRAVAHLHLPQARRGDGRGGPHRGAAPRAPRRRAAPGRHLARGARRADGRAAASPVRAAPSRTSAASSCPQTGSTWWTAAASGSIEVSFEVRAGETLAIVGVSGNGQSALGALVSGLMRPCAAHASRAGRTGAATRARWSGAGSGASRRTATREGAVGELTVWENVILERVRDARFAARGIVRRGPAKAHADAVVKRYDVRGGGAGKRAALLSGGNLQKLILGRNLIAGPRLLVAAQPTRGLDEGAIAEVHRDILGARDAGAGVLLISEDLDEVLALADRVQAIVGGRLSPPDAGRRARRAPPRPDDGRRMARGRMTARRAVSRRTDVMRLERRETQPALADARRADCGDRGGAGARGRC